MCSVAQHSLLQLLLGPTASSGSVRGGIQALWLFFCPAVAAARQPHPHICTPSLPRSLGSDEVFADHSGRDAPLLCSSGLQSAGCNLISSLSQDTGLHLWHLALLFTLPSSSLLQFSHHQMFPCADLSDVCVLSRESCVEL